MPSSPRHRARRTPRRTKLLALAASVLLAGSGALLVPEASGAPAADAGRHRAAEGARILAEEKAGARTLDLTVDSPALGTTARVRLILPKGFAGEPERRWPVLFLLQGAHDDYTSWTRETGVESFLADKDVLTVLPSSGPTGIPTDWWNFGLPGAQDYEAFQTEELGRLLRERFRAGERRAVAGVSTGGYGALALAARHPGTFGAAASYSGITDTTAFGMPTVLSAIVAREGKLPGALWGPPLLARANWNRHNPAALVDSLDGTGLYLSQGSGLPSEDFGNLEAAVLEGTLWGQAQGFARKLKAAGIPARVHFYQGGLHAWEFWEREFTASWPTLAAGLGLPG
ncbi:secreted protein [Streptomyces albus]|uniref:Acyl-CoA:diacylglycerol acyltransferase n=1 Tax=Streptomyces albus (strain ATCC 21838 / DSM 41398 / FERM P-419 / JCM 4703 / NBRC 107858) TaxID=1081613 RepID=A0A0B5F6F5_STRA4|nr:secreted protein [Streptomyces albus]AOU80215.1 secreted protein [Streptomyces albus]